MFHGLILLVHLFACIVLIAVILLQAGRGGGVADSIGGTAQSILGTRGAAYLTRATTVCAILFMFTSLTLAYLSVQQGRSLLESARIPAAAAAVPTQPPASTAPAPSAPPEQPSNPQ